MFSMKRVVLPLLHVALIAGLARGDEKKLVIAHRGASGYLPEHTLAAKVMAYAMGADYIEQDVVLTKDSCPVVLHDIHLDTVTDVATKFPSRSRADGRYYAIDFTLAEIRQLRVTERFSQKTGLAVYPKRFPLHKSHFTIPTLAEEIELIQGLNQSTGRNAGIYPEIKAPRWHREEGKDISRIVLSVLAKYGYTDKEDKIYLQCFEAEETKRIRRDLGSKLKLIQLIGSNKWKDASPDWDRLRTPEGVKEAATYADGIGPGMAHVVETDDSGKWRITPLVQLAHENGLEVHPYTLRKDSLQKYADDFNELHDIFFRQADVDGVFTDFPDAAVDYLRQRGGRP